MSTSTTAGSRNISLSAASSRLTSPSLSECTQSQPSDTPSKANPSANSESHPKTPPCTQTQCKAQFSSPISAFKQRVIHKASSVKLKIRRKNLPEKDRSRDPKVPEESSPRTTPCQPDTSLPDRERAPAQSLPRSSTLSPSDFEPLHQSIRSEQLDRQRQKGYLYQSISSHHTFIKMASETAQPPVSYSRLQQITTSACEKALGSITSYNHASTEDWNTTIINTILGTLVEETTPQSGDAGADAQPQPPFKYVVNSTIIQHAPVSSGTSGDPAVTGRRGMHAASGAFWSNEKDGMWSYKYSAAENKGFDVVVGIIWIFIG